MMNSLPALLAAMVAGGPDLPATGPFQRTARTGQAAGSGAALLLDFDTGSSLAFAVHTVLRFEPGPGLVIGHVMAIAFDCGPASVMGRHLPWRIKADSCDGGGIATGTIEGVHLDVTMPRCWVSVDGSSANSYDGELGFVYDDRNHEFEMTGGNLRFYDVVGPGDGYREGDQAGLECCLLVTPYDV